MNQNRFFENDNSSKQSLANDENSNKVETVDVSKPINCHTNANKNEWIFTCDHEINTYNYYKDNNKQNEGKYGENSIEYNKNNGTTKASIVTDSMTYQTNINHDKKCDNIMTIVHYTNPINAYIVYKDNAT